MSDHDPRFDRWDAAYVLGALSAADRRDYEDHLSVCANCRDQVAELGGLPGLLSRVPAPRALDQLTAAPSALAGAPGVPAEADGMVPPADLAERLHRQARRRRLRTAVTAAGAALVAAAVAVAVVLGLQSVRPGPTLTAELAPTAALGSPDGLTASVRLYSKAWGTEVDTECRHREASGGGQYARVRYGLYVVGSDGTGTLVSSWTGVAKSPIDTTAATATRIDQMSRLELRTIQDNKVLLSAPVHG